MKEDLDSVRRDNKEMLEQALARGAASDAATENITAEMQETIDKLEKEKEQLNSKVDSLT